MCSDLVLKMLAVILVSDFIIFYKVWLPGCISHQNVKWWKGILDCSQNDQYLSNAPPPPPNSHWSQYFFKSKLSTGPPGHVLPLESWRLEQSAPPAPSYFSCQLLRSLKPFWIKSQHCTSRALCPLARVPQTSAAPPLPPTQHLPNNSCCRVLPKSNPVWIKTKTSSVPPGHSFSQNAGDLIYDTPPSHPSPNSCCQVLPKPNPVWMK